MVYIFIYKYSQHTGVPNLLADVRQFGRKNGAILGHPGDIQIVLGAMESTWSPSASATGADDADDAYGSASRAARTGRARDVRSEEGAEGSGHKRTAKERCFGASGRWCSSGQQRWCWKKDTFITWSWMMVRS